MLLKKLFRTAWKYKAPFISMIIMVAIGVGVFVGFNAEWYSLQKDTEYFMEQTNYADYRIYNESGFLDTEIDTIKNIDGVEAASRVLSVSVNVGSSESNKQLSMFCLEDYVVSTMQITSGKQYDKNIDGFWLSDQYAKANNLSVGDSLTLVYRDAEISGTIVGLAKSSEYMICVADDNQLMPDYNTYGFVYVSPKKLSQILPSEYYPQINIKSNLSKVDIEKAINDALGKTTLVLSKNEHVAYAGTQGEIEEGQSMGSILPVLFLLIGALTMITTMHRITANEKTQIGTLKALGFKDKKILFHYTSYGLFIGLVGSLLGIGLGFGIAAFIINPNGMMGTYIDMTSWKLYVPWFCWFAVVGIIAFLTLISFLSVKKMLKGTAADALRPYTPKKMKPLKIEKTKVFNKLSFASKWNLRDIFRHKTRSLMTLFGVIGCVILLVGGLGMQDTMTGFLNTIDNQIYNYTTRVNIVETADNEDIISFANEYNGDWLASSSVELNGEAIALEIYNIENDTIRFIDKNNKNVELKDNGVYICLRLADGIKVGDTIKFSPYGGEETYTVTVAGIIRSVVTENITMTKEYAESIGLPYHINAVFTNSPSSDISSEDFILGKQSKQNIMESYNSFMEIMNTMVVALVLAAVVLGIIVLYNLGVMSYVERYRELATLKVVGFKDKKIGRILISQNMWLTILGIIIGIPAGVGVLQWLIITLASEYELKLSLGVLTYLVSIFLTLGVSLIVSYFVSRKNKKIDMVEALKGSE